MKDYTINNVISQLNILRENSTNTDERELILIAQNLIEQNFEIDSFVKGYLK